MASLKWRSGRSFLGVARNGRLPSTFSIPEDYTLIMDALLLHRIHFAFTVTYHYLFPQLTMGLALLIVVLKTIAIRCKDERYNEATRFWARIFAVNFLIGVVTGIPMEFQFGTNWSQFSRTTGGVIGQPLAMEGYFRSFWNRHSWGCFFSGKSAFLPGATGDPLFWSRRIMDFRLLHHCYKRMDAASSRAPDPAERRV